MGLQEKQWNWDTDSDSNCMAFLVAGHSQEVDQEALRVNTIQGFDTQLQGNRLVGHFESPDMQEQ